MTAMEPLMAQDDSRDSGPSKPDFSEQEELASYTVRFFNNGIKVDMKSPDRMTPRLIQRGLGHVYKEWRRQHRELLNKARLIAGGRS